MQQLDHIFAAMAELYPTAMVGEDWVYALTDDGAVMQTWNADKLGPLDMARIEAKNAEIAARPQLVVLTPGDLWRRTTEAEAEAIEDAMAAQPARLRNLFQRASEYRSDDPLWAVLHGAAVGLFGEARAAELLAPST